MVVGFPVQHLQTVMEANQPGKNAAWCKEDLNCSNYIVFTVKVKAKLAIPAW